MKYLEITRKVHLWLGLLIAVFLLVEAVTGLILSEPTLIGAAKPHSSHEVRAAIENGSSALPKLGNSQTAEVEKHVNQIAGDVSALVFIKQLHQGIIQSNSFRWIVDIIAVSIIVLTLTGIYLSIPLLKSQFKSKS
jgi:hypothetical protein